jgi:REP element-mobilizing transposase RayT
MQSSRARNFKAGSLSTIINSFKASVTATAHRDFPNLPMKIWHRNYFDTIIRDEEHLNNLRQYIADNVKHWEE